ncbi:MAG: hypothetical protein F6K18_11305 [Okeania sp. SIO2C2]|uniref:hypothetical protein n=1 Tax=Okeania sp. SIO2C2 TaxID=2607787 RepID=UPI0013BB0453|nr:hypothetical protein [Okeania sp. SIO2C2]NEP87365.1 hypothetical protein [Okeania sp. SIO2C2]
MVLRVCAQKSFSRGRRQEKTHPSPLPLRWRGRQETGEMGMSEEVEVRIVRIIFLPNYAPKILTF